MFETLSGHPVEMHIVNWNLSLSFQALKMVEAHATGLNTFTDDLAVIALQEGNCSLN